MSASVLIVAATFLFASMGVCVKLASSYYDASEIVMYRSLIGVVLVGGSALLQGKSLRTSVPLKHVGRSLAGVLALSLWFYAIGRLPLTTAMTLNYMSSVWMAVFMMGAALLFGQRRRVQGRLVLAVLLGFVGVALVLRPTLEQDQIGAGLIGLVAGMLSALAYLQVAGLGKAGEPEYRIVFYFSLGGVLAGGLITAVMHWTGTAGTSPGGLHGHTPRGLALLLAVGLLATAAQLAMTRAYGRGKALVNASLQYLGIVFSVGYGVLLFDDALPASALLGMGLIVAAGIGATLWRSADAESAPPNASEKLR